MRARLSLSGRIQLDNRLKVLKCGADIDDITPNFGCYLQAGPAPLGATPAVTVLEVGAGAASSSLPVTPPVSAYSYA